MKAASFGSLGLKPFSPVTPFDGSAVLRPMRRGALLLRAGSHRPALVPMLYVSALPTFGAQTTMFERRRELLPSCLAHSTDPAADVQKAENPRHRRHQTYATSTGFSRNRKVAQL